MTDFVYMMVFCNDLKDLLMALRSRLVTFKLMQPVVKGTLLTPHYTTLMKKIELGECKMTLRVITTRKL